MGEIGIGSSRVKVTGTASDPEPFRKEVWGILPGKEPQPAKVLAEDKDNMDCVVEESNTKYQQNHETIV
jgi:hypothetical protein